MAKAKGGKRKGAGRKVDSGGKWNILDMANKLEIVEGWARDGATIDEMCSALKISVQTFHNWKKKYPEFAEAIRKGKDVIDRQVEAALYKRALGYEIWEDKQEMQYRTDANGDYVRDENGNFIQELVTVERKLKHIHADTTAQIFWLKNRKPHQWRDKQQIEHSGIVGTADLSYMSDDEIEKELNRLEALNNGRKR